MKYKFENEDQEYLEFGISEKSIQVELGRSYDEYYGGFLNIQYDEIDKLIKALQELKDEIDGKETDTFKMIKPN